MAGENNVMHEGGQLPFKSRYERVKGVLYRFDIAESRYGNQNTL
jgi:hypothetical protein